MGYPAIVLDEAGPEVPGLVFTSEELGRHWRRLDEFEGEGYKRVVVPVTLESGTTVRAHVYELRKADSPVPPRRPPRSMRGRPPGGDDE